MFEPGDRIDIPFFVDYINHNRNGKTYYLKLFLKDTVINFPGMTERQLNYLIKTGEFLK